MTANTKRIGSFAILAAIYLFAGIAGVLLYRYLPFSYWLRLLCADVAATAVLFAFSCLLGNASVYDPYWSVFPPVALTLLAFGRPLTALNQLHLIAVWVWGLRLTANWAYTFQGLDHQDWRYTMLREKSGRAYPFVNFFGIHLVPTLIVYGCMLPAFYSLEHGLRTGVFSYLFVLLSLSAAAWQAVADCQMHAFRRHHHGELIHSGLWKRARHPNYLGEILMWWGIALSVVFAPGGEGWLLAGALSNTLLFVFISIPMADARQAQKPGYAEYRAQTRVLLPIGKK
ncbi:MAG: DUF1295 domain-containing protein [Clostridia bacterium]|nr:DUF1295 domain-containing protein [Clostridia bacterium]